MEMFYAFFQLFEISLMLMPGVLVALWWFPKNGWIFKLSSGAVLSLVYWGALALALNMSPWGLSAQVLWWALGITLLVESSIIIFLRRRRAPGSRVALNSLSTAANRINPTTALITGALAIGFVVLFPYLDQVQRERFTAFYIKEATQADAPWRRVLLAQESPTVTAVVINRERRTTHYWVALVSDGRVLAALDVGKLPPGSESQQIINIPPSAQSHQRYELYLYRVDALGAGRYRTLWFNVSRQVASKKEGDSLVE